MPHIPVRRGLSDLCRFLDRCGPISNERVLASSWVALNELAVLVGVDLVTVSSAEFHLLKLL